MTYSAYRSPHRDETIIPILCNSERTRTSTPVQMRSLVHSPSSSVPLTRRIYSGTDLRYAPYSYQQYYPPPPPPPPTTPPYYSPQPQQYLLIDPYRTIRSRPGDNTWHPVLLQSGYNYNRYPHLYRQYHMNNRSLSQRLWDIDSGDDENEVEEDIVKVAGRVTPSKERTFNYHSSQFENANNVLLHIDDDVDDDELEDPYRKQYADV